jgi:Protein of unknown function (DUF1579)
MENLKAEELNQLRKFVGRWNTSGVIRSSGNTPGEVVTGIDTYEWLPGEYFLLHKADVSIGIDKSETFEIIGFDSKIGKFTMQYYDNKGGTGLMLAECQDDNWEFVGDDLRFSGGFKNEGTEFSGIWEQRTEESKWTPFMEIALIKAG